MYSLSPFTNAKNSLRRYIRALFGRDHGFRQEIHLVKRRLGTLYGGWWVCDEVLMQARQPVALSFGIGCDISFDIEMITRYGALVYAFDPTPKSIDWLSSQSDLPSGFNALPIGVSSFDGVQDFALPSRPTWDDYSAAREGMAKITCPVKKISTIIKDLALSKVDVLKLDVEGSEYSAIKDLILSAIRPRQILVEFHYEHRPSGVKLVSDAVQNLRGEGYLIFDVSPWGREFSFIHKSAIPLIMKV